MALPSEALHLQILELQRISVWSLNWGGLVWSADLASWTLTLTVYLDTFDDGLELDSVESRLTGSGLSRWIETATQGAIMRQQ